MPTVSTVPTVSMASTVPTVSMASTILQICVCYNRGGQHSELFHLNCQDQNCDRTRGRLLFFLAEMAQRASLDLI